MTEYLPGKIHQQIRSFCREHAAIRSVVLFGSRARGDHSRLSDVDLLISAPQATAGEWARMALFLKEDINSLLDVDVLRWEEASPSLRRIAQKEGKLIYARR